MKLAVKVGSKLVGQALGEDLSRFSWGLQLVARRYVWDCRISRVLLKIDMRNAFTSMRRDSFLSVARIRTPGIYSFLWQAYYSPNRLFFDHEGFASETGIQQGDPIGATLFALSVDEAALGVQLEFNVWYFDDTTFGNSSERIHNNLVVLLERLRAIDLEVMGANVISPFSMTACHRQEKPCSEGTCRWLGWLKRVTFYCWEPR